MATAHRNLIRIRSNIECVTNSLLGRQRVREVTSDSVAATADDRFSCPTTALPYRAKIPRILLRYKWVYATRIKIWSAVALYRRYTVRAAYLLTTAPLLALTVLAAEAASHLLPAWL